MPTYLSESFDDAKVLDLRLLHEASRRASDGEVTVDLWTDAAFERVHGRPPKFPYAEREYFVASMRFVTSVVATNLPNGPSAAPATAAPGDVWVYRGDTPWARDRDAALARAGLVGGALSPDRELAGFPAELLTPSLEMWRDASAPGRKKVVVTGCYDYFHSGHVRFFEECSELGDLYVCVGHDANVRALKGPKNPLFPDVERRYTVGCCRFVRQALVTTGHGYMDAAPEFARIKPDLYAVNEDGDKPDKAEWCKGHGVEYRVLKRLPKPGLPKRTSTDMRGF